MAAAALGSPTGAAAGVLHAATRKSVDGFSGGARRAGPPSRLRPLAAHQHAVLGLSSGSLCTSSPPQASPPVVCRREVHRARSSRGRLPLAPPCAAVPPTGGGDAPPQPDFQSGVNWFCLSTIGLISLADFSPLPLLVRAAGEGGGAVLAAAQWGLFVAPTLKFMHDQGYDIRHTLRLDTLPQGRHVAAGVLGGGSLWALVSVATALRLAGDDLAAAPAFSSASQLIAPPAAGGGLGAALALSALSPAVAEELLFRGFLLTAMASELGRVDAVFATAAMFGLIHLDPARFFGDAMLGVACGGLALASGSIAPPVALHTAHNAAALAWGAAQCDELGACASVLPGWAGPTAAAGGAVALALAWPGGGEPPGGSEGPGGEEEGSGVEAEGAGGGARAAVAAREGEDGDGEVVGPDMPGGRVWLFGYGAMMDRLVQQRRQVTPAEAVPAVCPDLALRFNHLNGYANLDPWEGSGAAPCAHGVLQLITYDELARVRRKEGGYRVRSLDAVAYDGRRVRALYFQSRPETRLRRDVAPRQRYLEKLQRGAREAGVDEAYQAWLGALPSLPDGAAMGDEYGDAPSKQLAIAVVAAAGVAACFAVGAL